MSRPPRPVQLRPARVGSVVLLALALTMAAVPAAGFASQPSGKSPHETLTEATAEGAGFPPDGIAALKKAVIAPDLDEMDWDPRADSVARIDADGSYRADHHCDRVPPTRDVVAFNATVAFVASQVEAAIAASQAGDPDKAVELLGYALHAAQDCASHSNAVDVDVAATFPGMVLGDTPPPVGLKVTGFLPGADDPEKPDGDPYPHGEFAKDLANGTPEAKRAVALTGAGNVTKYEAARALAEATSQELLVRFLARLDGEQVKGLAGVDVETDDKLPDLGTPGPAPWLTAMAVVALALLVRRRA